MKKLYKEYKENFGYLWFKELKDAESFVEYLKVNKLFKGRIRTTSERSADGWGYVVMEVI